MRRMLPAPLLSASLFVLWLALNRSAGTGHLLLGALLAVCVPRLTASLRPLPVRIRRPGVVLRLVLAVGLDVITSNLMVGWRVLRAGRQTPDSAFIEIPLELRDPNGLAALAMITTVIPGTIWSELAPDRSALLLHVFHLGDDATFVEHFRSRYEQPLKEIFE